MKIGICDFWPSFNLDVNFFFTNYFKKLPNIEFTNSDPDLMICSTFDQKRSQYDGPKLMFGAENLHLWNNPNKDINDCDWAFLSFDHKHLPVPYTGKYTYLPYIMVDHDLNSLDSSRQRYSNVKKDKFCCFVYSNGSNGAGTKLRNQLFLELSKYKKVDAAGSLFNNCPKAPYGQEYLDWLSSYKFMICFENSSAPGYITEKCLNPYLVNTIPIYWSHPSSLSYFNYNSMIFYDDSLDYTIKRIKELDQNDNLYRSMQQESIFHGTEVPWDFRRERIYAELDKIIEEIK